MHIKIADEEDELFNGKRQKLEVTSLSKSDTMSGNLVCYHF